MTMKRMKVKATREDQLRKMLVKKTEWLQSQGVARVLIVYDDKQTASVYPDRADSNE
jgi:hypothetical protein